MTLMAQTGTAQYTEQIGVNRWALARTRRLVTTHMCWWGFGPLAEDVAQCVHERQINWAAEHLSFVALVEPEVRR